MILRTVIVEAPDVVRDGSPKSRHGPWLIVMRDQGSVHLITSHSES